MRMTRNTRKTHNAHLRDPAVAAGYLNDAFESNDSAVILMALRNIADAQEDGISGLATQTKLGRESMYKMLTATGNPKLTTLSTVLTALGLQLQVKVASLPTRSSG